MNEINSIDNFEFFSGVLVVTDPLDYENKKILVPVPFLRHQLRYIYDKNGKLLTRDIGDGKQDVVIGDNLRLDIEHGVLPDITPGVEYKVLEYRRTGPTLHKSYDTRRVTSPDLNYGGARKRKRSKSNKKSKSKSKNRKTRRTRHSRHRKY
jgi:hypothetical protein